MSSKEEIDVQDDPRDSIPPKVRKTIYLLYVLAVAVLGSVTAYLSSTVGILPDWVIGSNSALVFIAGYIGVQSYVYTPHTPVSAVKNVDAGIATIEPSKAATREPEQPVEQVKSEPQLVKASKVTPTKDVDYTSTSYAPEPGATA